MALDDILVRDEWILFQIKEGPCSAGCTYCYERPVVSAILERAQNKGTIPKTDLAALNNAQLAGFITQNREKLGLELSLDEIKRYFAMLKEAGITRAGLIGSEPTTHSQFSGILDAAQETHMDLLVYTAGMSPDKLLHPAVRYIVLHLDYGRLGEKAVQQLFKEGRLPPDAHMEKINNLIEQDKQIDLRVNFASPELLEQDLIFNFYTKLRPHNRPKVLLKYSISTQVHKEPQLPYFTPATLKDIAPKLIGFVDRFKEKFLETQICAERPLFPCAFPEKEWKIYQKKGGFVAGCDMEYTVYPNTGLALCPPSRDLIPGERITTTTRLVAKIGELREQLKELWRIPSFNECEPCPLRKNLTCQGGCLGYKVGKQHEQERQRIR